MKPFVRPLLVGAALAGAAPAFAQLAPFIDADNGGSLNGVIEFSSKVLAQIDADYVSVPGHGSVANYQALADYVAMLTTIRDRMKALIDSGATLQQVTAARLTSEWDKKKGEPASFLNRAYTSL